VSAEKWEAIFDEPEIGNKKRKSRKRRKRAGRTGITLSKDHESQPTSTHGR
jgi:hypothetical protein